MLATCHLDVPHVGLHHHQTIFENQLFHQSNALSICSNLPGDDQEQQKQNTGERSALPETFLF